MRILRHPRTRLLACAVAVWLLQFWLVLRGTQSPSLGSALMSFGTWDSTWYESIAEYGFWQELPAGTPHAGAQTVAWFPAFPLTGRAVHWALGTDIRLSLMITAALGSLLFWLYLAAISEKVKLPWPYKAAVAVLIVAHPAAFFMLSEYSESMFLAATLGFCFWLSRSGRAGLGWAAFHGFVASATRLIGMPIAGLPWLSEFLWPSSRDSKRWLRPLAVSALGCAGGLAYFAFLQFRFGNWRLYMDTQMKNWGIRPDYSALLRPASYAICRGDLLEAGCLSQNSVGLTLLLLGISGVVLLLSGALNSQSVRQDDRIRAKLAVALYGSAIICFVISVAGLASRGMVSMIRYTYPSYVLALVVICLGLSEFRLEVLRSRWFQVAICGALLALAVGLFGIQNILILRFIRAAWVA